jgi:hypothetical protein
VLAGKKTVLSLGGFLVKWSAIDAKRLIQFFRENADTMQKRLNVLAALYLGLFWLSAVLSRLLTLSSYFQPARHSNWNP